MPIDLEGMAPDTLWARLINAGINLARQVGQGLGLVNALRDEFDEVPLEAIGQAVTTIGEGVNAAIEHNARPGSELIDLDILPVVPNDFFDGGESSRVTAFADVEVETIDPLSPDDEPDRETWDVRTECGEGLTFDELIACIEAHVQEFAEDSPDLNLQPIINRFIHVYFMGKRF